MFSNILGTSEEVSSLTQSPETLKCDDEESTGNIEKQHYCMELAMDVSVEAKNKEEEVQQYQQESPSHSFENFREVAIFKNEPTNKQYFIGCKWSPDGTCLISNCADFTLRIIDLPQEFHSKQFWDKNDDTVLTLKPSLKAVEGGLVYDYAWYPFMSSWDPPTCCFITSSSSSPIHLWDAYTGKIRASYRAYDYADEVHSAYSLAFSTSGEDIYCGFKNCIKVFDVSNPGRDCETFNLKELSGQKGLVSCICENPSVPELFAAGTYTKNLGLYTRSNEFVCLLTGQKSGLTHLQFSDDGLKLYSGARMDNEILCWDIRNPGIVLFSMKRVVKTNQRIYFDITKDNKYLISGGTDGNLRIWDVSQDLSVTDYDLKSVFTSKAHNDCLNGISMHCRYPIIATCSGQKHRLDLTNDEDDGTMFDDKIAEKAENSIKLWWIGSLSSSQENKDMEL